MPNKRKRPPNINKKNSWGGYEICFKDQQITAEELFGDKNLTVGQMLSRLWQFAKSNGLTSKSRPYAPPRILKRDRVAQVAQQQAE